jgi:hypothetical protein
MYRIEKPDFLKNVDTHSCGGGGGAISLTLFTVLKIAVPSDGFQWIENQGILYVFVFTVS